VYLTCSTKLTGSQLSPPHGTNKKLKCETKNKEHDNMLQGVLQVLNALSIHVTFRAFRPGAAPGETKMWSGVGKMRDF